MASGSGLATALAALKAHAVAATVVGALVVGGGAATVAVTTGTVQVPGVNIHAQSTKTDTDASATPRAAACATNGDAARLAGIFAPMFGGDKTVAQSDICTLFVGTNGHAMGLGEVQQALEITAAIEKSSSQACLTASPDHGQSSTGKPSTAGTPQSGNGNGNDAGNNKGSQGSGQATFTAPQESATTTMGIVAQVLTAEQHGTPLAQLAKNCGAVTATGNTGNTTDNGNTGNNGNDNSNDGNGHPNGTPTAKPTGTPGHGHP